MMKRWISLLLAMALCLSLFSMTVLAANPFRDVPASQWYYADVTNAYEMGLINGKTATEFKPDDNLRFLFLKENVVDFRLMVYPR